MTGSVPLSQRSVRRLAASRGGSWLFARVLPRIDRFVLRVTGGRRTATAVLAGLPVVRLTTTGRRTGLPRTVFVLGVPIGDDIAVAAGNFGRPEDPAWCTNLRGDRRAQLVLDGRPRAVVAEELTGSAREDVWGRVIEVYPGAAAYEHRAGNRTIGVFLLRTGTAEQATDTR
jgi:deazaflavin-dependent oxidoreductase (nitroreductase family)